MFLAEPWLFQCDLSFATSLYSSSYSCFLNSDDLYDPDIPLSTSRPHGGTMAFWKKELDPYVTIAPVNSSRFLPLVLDIPGYQTTIHIALYLPTAGKESEFVQELAALNNIIEELGEKYSNALFYIRGDANAASIPRSKNKRDQLFSHFCQDNSLAQTCLDHPTYHHFLGDGRSDSSIDVLLSSSCSSDGIPNLNQDILSHIICSKQDTIINSHHDAIVSSLSISPVDSETNDLPQKAPRLENNRHKILWEDCSDEYSSLVSPVLSSLRETWSESPSATSTSIMLQMTSQILSSAAKATNRVHKLSSEPKAFQPKIDPEIASAMKIKSTAHKNLLDAKSEEQKTDAKLKFTAAKTQLQKLERFNATRNEVERDKKLHTIITSNPKLIFKEIKTKKSGSKTIFF